MDKLDQVSGLILSRSDILLTSHIRLDGDAVGAELALAQGLRRLGKTAHIVNDGAVPEVYRFLRGAERIGTSPAALPPRYDLIVVLDAPSLARTGKIERALRPGVSILNIDHHVSNTGFGDVAWVDAEASSAGEMICRLLKRMGVEIANDIAVALYAAIATDTGRFLHSNTTPDALRMVADMLAAGVNLADANNALYRSTSFGLLRLKALATQDVSLFAEGRIACMRLTRRRFAETGTDPLDTQEFIEIPRSVQGVEVAVLLCEMEDPPHIKVSLRSNTRTDVCAIAARFGGGGHLRAAGCEIAAPIEEAQGRIIEAVEAALCAPTPP